MSLQGGGQFPLSPLFRGKIHIHGARAPAQGNGCGRSHPLHFQRPCHIVRSVAAGTSGADVVQHPPAQLFVAFAGFSGDAVIAAGGVQPPALCGGHKAPLGHRVDFLAPDSSQFGGHRLKDIPGKGALQGTDPVPQSCLQPLEDAVKIIIHTAASLSAASSP